jgi:hypothetical protein
MEKLYNYLKGGGIAEGTIRTLNVLSAVIMLAVGIYIESVFWFLLTPLVRGMIEVGVWLYFFSQIDLFSVTERDPSPRNKRSKTWK